MDIRFVVAAVLLAFLCSCGGGESSDAGPDAEYDGGGDGGAPAPIETYGNGGWEYYGSGCDVWGLAVKVNTKEAIYCEGISSSEKSANLVWREIDIGYGLKGVIPSGACCQKGGDRVTGVFACEYAGTGYVSAHRRELLAGTADGFLLLCNVRSVHDCELK